MEECTVDTTQPFDRTLLTVSGTVMMTAVPNRLQRQRCAYVEPTFCSTREEKHHPPWSASSSVTDSTSSSMSDHWLVRLTGGSKRGSVLSGDPNPAPLEPVQTPESPQCQDLWCVKGRTQMHFFKKSKRFIFNQTKEYEQKARQSRIIKNAKTLWQNKTMV